MRGDKRIAVIVVNYGNYAQRYLNACYTSLLSQTYPAELLTIFLVNNAATDEARQLAAQIAPTARFLENAGNVGWAGGNNTAVRVALAGGFDYLVFLNMDATAACDWLAELVKTAETRTDLHILQSRILLDGTARVNSLGNRIHFLGYGYCQGYGVEGGRPVRRQPTIDFASGAAMLVKREVFEHTGLFREDYFMYYDDLEFCWRARLAGYNVGLVADSICYHRCSSQNAFRFLYHSQRNRLLTLLTLEKCGTILLTLPCLILAECVVSVYFVTKGWGRTQWDVLRYFCKPSTWRAIFAIRREVKRFRRRKDADIVRAFSGWVHSPHIDNWFLRYVCNPLLWLYWTIVRTVIVW